MKDRLIDFFTRNAPDMAPEELADSVLGIVEHNKKSEAVKSRETEAIKKALRKVEQAIAALDKVDSPRVEHLRRNLTAALDEAGDPNEKDAIKSSHIHIAGPGFEQERVISSEISPRAKNARLIFALEGFWLRTFGERPSDYREHEFYELAAIVCPGTGGRELEASSVYSQRKRVAKPTPTIGDK